jgi:tetratricopeptide (TPR) repeat protein
MCTQLIRQDRRLVLGLLLLLICALPIVVSAQYQGSPVTRDRLVQTLKSRQFQTADIIQVIREHGVDFRLTPAIEAELVAAGARPGVIDAVRRNYRGGMTGGRSGPTRGGESYSSLIEDAIEAYDVRRNYKEANDLLLRATNLQPRNPRAFQLLGYLNLYGFKNFNEAERYWKQSLSLGGAAVLRVIHDHDGVFSRTCQGSLYISRSIVRFEGDTNEHTFETTDSNIKKIEVNNRFVRLFQLKGGSFKLVLEREDGRSNYNFAPLSGKSDESKMIIRLIGK